MERKIGEIFEIDDVWYQFVEVNRGICDGCVFYQSKIKCTNPDEYVKCSKWHREDGKDGHFVRLLPIGDVYEQGGAIWQQYKCVDKPNTEDKRVYISHTDSDIGLIISVRLTENDDLNLIERKIGEIFEHNGEWYQCVNQNGCCNCAFYNTPCHLMDELSCDSLNKKRKERYIFKKLEKAGEPFIINGKKYQRYITHVYPYILNELNSRPIDDSIVLIEVKQNKEDMKENNNPELSNSENIGKNLREFDLEAAKAGKPVCTRDGRKARIICFDRVTNSTNEYTGHLIVLVTNPNGDERSFYYTEKGNLAGRDEYDNHKWDLMMLPEKREGWVNIYKETKGEYYMDKIIHKTEKFAFDVACPDNYIGTVKIEWYE